MSAVRSIGAAATLAAMSASVPRTMRSSASSRGRRPPPDNRRHRAAPAPRRSRRSHGSRDGWRASPRSRRMPRAFRASGMREARPRDARQHHALRHFRHGQFARQGRRRRRKSRHARRQRVGNAAPVEPAHLLGDRAVDREIAGMQPRDVLAGCMRRREFRVDLVERHRRGVDDARARRAMREQSAAPASRHKGRPGSAR